MLFFYYEDDKMKEKFIEKYKKNKLLFTIIAIFLIVLLVVSGTYAYVLFSANVTNGNYISESECFLVDYSADTISGTLFPSLSAQNGLSTDVSLQINEDCNLCGEGSLYLNVDSGTSSKYLETVSAHCENRSTLETLHSYDNSTVCETNGGIWVTNGSALKYSVYDTSDSSQIAAGYVNSYGKSEIANNIIVDGYEKNFTVYIWLDGWLAGNDYANLSFAGSINASAVQNSTLSEYQQVEYLQSSGTQYIDTRFIPSSNTDIEIVFKYLGAETTAWVPICGERSGNSTTYLNFFINASNLKLTPNYAGYDPGATSGFPSITVGTKYKLSNHGGKFYLDDVLKDSTVNTLTVGTTPIYVFAIGSGTGVDNRQIRIQLYSFKIFDNGVLVMNLVPAYHKSDGVKGLYDTINDGFYVNSGSGEFVIGPNV